MPPVHYQFCPVCGAPYPPDQIGTPSHHCDQCQFVFYENQGATASAVIWQNNQLLLVKRALQPRQGYWDFPGGYVELHEPPQEAVIREVQEELGVPATVERLFNVYGPTQYEYQGLKRYNCDVYFLVKLESSILQPADDVAGAQWFSLDQLPPPDQIAFPAQLELIEDIRQAFTPSNQA